MRAVSAVRDYRGDWLTDYRGYMVQVIWYMLYDMYTSVVQYQGTYIAISGVYASETLPGSQDANNGVLGEIRFILNLRTDEQKHRQRLTWKDEDAGGKTEKEDYFTSKSMEAWMCCLTSPVIYSRWSGMSMIQLNKGLSPLCLPTFARLMAGIPEEKDNQRNYGM